MSSSRINWLANPKMDDMKRRSAILARHHTGPYNLASAMVVYKKILLDFKGHTLIVNIPLVRSSIAPQPVRYGGRSRRLNNNGWSSDG
jgi:hypothetical protein